MQIENTTTRTGESVWLWLIKIITGVFIVALLLIHLIVNHLLPATGLLTHSEVVAYYQNISVMVMEAFFLIFVVSHSLIGTRSIILDLRPSDSVLRLLDGLLILIGLISTVYGIWLIQAVNVQG